METEGVISFAYCIPNYPNRRFPPRVAFVKEGLLRQSRATQPNSRPRWNLNTILLGQHFSTTVGSLTYGRLECTGLRGCVIFFFFFFFVVSFERLDTESTSRTLQREGVQGCCANGDSNSQRLDLDSRVLPSRPHREHVIPTTHVNKSRVKFSFQKMCVVCQNHLESIGK